jgi:formylmethanofuran dehydrogenase subunit E
VIRHHRCEECGELVEEHRMIEIGDGWFCLNVQDCLVNQRDGA